MTFLRAIQLINCCVMLVAMGVNVFGRGETQEKARVIRNVSLIICWIFIILL